MRSAAWICLALLAPVAGCADAPITPAHLEADGQLRQGLEQHVFGAPERAPEVQTAQALQLTAVLADRAQGPIEDRARFAPGPSASVFLHLRADKLSEPRPVRFVWSRGEQREETMGFLTPSDTLVLAASRAVTPADVGRWKVEVVGVSPFGTDPLLFEREFEVSLDPDR
jgi:hypothetical protein